jgi:hypothetical protein
MPETTPRRPLRNVLKTVQTGRANMLERRAKRLQSRAARVRRRAES